MARNTAPQTMNAEEFRRRHLLTVAEDDVQEYLRDGCVRHGLVYSHNRDSRRTHPGVPDTLIIGPVPGRRIWAECKKQDPNRHRLTVEQETWAAVLAVQGEAFHLYRPADIQPQPGGGVCVVERDLRWVAGLDENGRRPQTGLPGWPPGMRERVAALFLSPTDRAYINPSLPPVPDRLLAGRR